MVNGGDRQIEEEVIRSSRELYCKSKEEIEREINNWSGMSLGADETSSSSGNSSGPLEKFKIVCSLCKQEKTVPFKPESGRPVYCKECIAKVKSGEVKVEKGPENQMRYDDSRFFKPLADLGIEFEAKETKIEEKDRYPDRKEKPHSVHIMDTVKKVFHVNRSPKPQDAPKPAQNFKKPESHNALKDVLNKALATNSQPKIPEPVKPIPAPAPVPTPKPISLDVLKDKMNAVKQAPAGKDRAATPEEMNKLKDLIKEKVTTPAEATPPPKGGEETTPAQNPSNSSGQATPQAQKQAPEVPEDVLRKILE